MQTLKLIIVGWFSLILPMLSPAITVTPGARVVGEPIFVNIYWDNNWDTNMAAFPLTSRASLDIFTRAVCDGSYFDKLGQYGVHHPTFAGSVVLGTPSPATVDQVQIAALLERIINNPPAGTPSTDPTRTIYNIFLSPTSTLVLPGPHAASESNTGGYHSCDLVPRLPICLPYVIIVPTNNITHGSKLCSTAGILTNLDSHTIFKQLTASLTHEMVEASTDPDGITGWRDRSVEEGEIADFNGTSSCFLAGNTANYYSKDDDSILSGPNDMMPPMITSVDRWRWGFGLDITITGHGFGPPPPDFPTLPATGKTAFLIVQNTTPNTNIFAGHLATSLNVQIFSWRDDQIHLGANGDNNLDELGSISVQVFGRNNGQESAVFTLPAPVAKNVYLDPATVPSNEASPVPLAALGRVLDQFNKPFLTTNIFWQFSRLDDSGFITNCYVSSDLDGWFHVPVPLTHSGNYQLRLSCGEEAHATNIFNIYPRILSIKPDHYALGITPAPVIIHGFGLAEVTKVSFKIVDEAPRSRDPNGEWIGVTPPPIALEGNHIGWLDVVTSVSPSLVSTVQPNDLFCYYRAGIPVMRTAARSFDCNPAVLTAVIWDAQGNPFVNTNIISSIRFRTSLGSFTTNGEQTEFTPLTMSGNEVFASLNKGLGMGESPATQPYLCDVGLVGMEDSRSSRQVNFNETLCRIMQQSGRIQSLASHMNIRDMLKDMVNPPIPKDRFASFVRPLQVEYKTVQVNLRDKVFTHEVQIQVTDAKGKPVTGLPILFLTTTGVAKDNTPVLTNAKGLAIMAVGLSNDGVAKVEVLVDEYSKPLMIQITKK